MSRSRALLNLLRSIPYVVLQYRSNSVIKVSPIFALPDLADAYHVTPISGRAFLDLLPQGKNAPNKHADKKLHAGRGGVGKTVVAGVRDRETNRISAAVVDSTRKRDLQSFVAHRVELGADLYTDELASYRGLPNHHAVKHGVGQYVDGQAHVNGMESFWALMKRGYYGIYHRMSPKHLDRYVDEFSGRHNIRCQDTIDQMAFVARGLLGKLLRYRDLIKPNGRPSGASGARELAPSRRAVPQ